MLHHSNQGAETHVELLKDQDVTWEYNNTADDDDDDDNNNNNKSWIVLKDLWLLIINLRIFQILIEL